MTIQEKRQELRNMSQVVRPLVKQGEYASINEAIKEVFYKAEGHTELKTYHEWRKEGKRVNKGEKALILWATPKRTAKTADTGEQDEYSFSPICHLFSQKQVV